MTPCSAMGGYRMRGLRACALVSVTQHSQSFIPTYLARRVVTAPPNTYDRPAVFVGRTSERRRVEELLAGASSGPGRAIVVLGDPGIGKTALLEQIAADASSW